MPFFKRVESFTGAETRRAKNKSGGAISRFTRWDQARKGIKVYGKRLENDEPAGSVILFQKEGMNL